jgi:hypothetical protein
VTQKSYVQLFRPTVGIAGNSQLGIRVLNVSNGDYLLVTSDLNKITAAAYIGISGAAQAISAIASAQFPGTAVCLTLVSTAGVSLTGDDVDILLLGPAAAAS